MRTLIVAVLLAFASVVVPAQQVSDPDFAPPIPQPAFGKGKGPVIFIDEAHVHFHTASGRYEPFAKLLERDGYVVRPFTDRFSKVSLSGGRILVISNALAERNRDDWSLPTPSAFADDEIKAVRDWVEGGGSLLLIADHMPLPERRPSSAPSSASRSATDSR